MNQQMIADFVKMVTDFGPVRAKYLPRQGKAQRITGATVVADSAAVKMKGEGGDIVIPLAEIEQIMYAREDRKFFVHLADALVELRPDDD